jgi:hypothetical protein
MSKYPESGQTGVTPADLQWLTGSWKGLHGEDPADADWCLLSGGMMMGMFRWQRGGTVEGMFLYQRQ